MDTEYLKKVGLYVLSAILSLAIVFYFGYHIWHSFTKEIETTAATQVTFEETIETKGYIFRTEMLLSGAGNAQSVIPTVSEGEHIRKGGQVAKLYSAFAPDTVARIAEIEKQIDVLSRYSDTGSVSLKDTGSIDEEIFSILSDIRGYADSGNVGGAAGLRQNLVATVGEREVLTGSYSDISAEIKELENEKNSLASRLGSLLGTVSTPYSGFYYSETDGYETVFKAEDLEDIGIADLRKILIKEPGEVSTAGKTVTESRWYLVCMIDESEKNTYSVGKNCTVKFKNTELSVIMEVSAVLHDKDGTAVILTTNAMPQGFDFYRMQDVELVKAEYTGIKVPLGAVRLINGETGVYILDVSTVSFRRIEILYTTENSYIAAIPSESNAGGEEGDGDTPSLRIHDSIITEGKGLYEGRVVGG